VIFRLWPARPPGDADRVFHPPPQRLDILEDLCGEFVVLHYLAPLTIGTKGLQSPGGEAGPSGVIHFEIQSVIGHEREEEITRINTDSTEHAAAANAGSAALELLECEDAKAVGDAHVELVSGPLHLA
jgi:hypothetical protein